MQNNQEFGPDSVKIIDCFFQWSKTLFLEAWHSIHEPNAINEHITFLTFNLQGPRQSQVTFSRGSYKALIYIRTPFMLKKVIEFLTETFTQKGF